jgi:DNA primase large subunit
MPVSFDAFTETDFAKYPFLKGTAERIRPLDLRIETLLSDDMTRILRRAEERVSDAITSLKIRDPGERINTDIEILSYPVALLLVTSTENSFIQKRYALAEAKQASKELAGEPKEKLLKIAENFGWKLHISPKQSEVPHEFVLHFADYLRNTTHLRDKTWKLINRILVAGNVYIDKADVARLLEEEIKRTIEKRLEFAEPSKLPPQLVEITDRIKKLAVDKIGKEEMDGFPKVVSQSAFPPCIVALYEAASKGRHLSHVGRFTLTSFLVSIGMPSEKVNELFKSFSDYNERLTRYQIEHIAGERGSRTRYTPPQCTTLQTHSVCVNSDALCRLVRHPLAYYKRKLKR